MTRRRSLAWTLAMLAGGCTPFESAPGTGNAGGTTSSGAVTPSSAFCQSVAPHVLCDDFERDSIPQSGWKTETTRGSTLAIDPTQAATTARRSMKVTIPADTDSNAFLYFPVPENTRRFDITFAMRLDALPEANTQFVAIEFEPRNRIFLLWKLRLQVLAIAEQRYPPDGGPEEYGDADIGAPPLGRFVQYRMEIDLDTNTAKLTSPSDPTLGARHTLKRPRLGATRYTLGNTYTDAPKRPFAIWYDDVVIR